MLHAIKRSCDARTNENIRSRPGMGHKGSMAFSINPFRKTEDSNKLVRGALSGSRKGKKEVEVKW